jgi:hypothetical protein
MKRLAVNVALVVGAVLVSLALGEVALRAFRFSYPSFWLPDELIGARLRPGIEGWSRGEGEAYVMINSRGLRDREHAMPKPPGVYRIAVLGDSYAEALQVELEETFWWLLAERLQACAFRPGKRIEAVNFGVSGYGTAQQLLTLRHHAWDYSPDLVLLAFFPGNDVRDNSLALEGKKNRPFFVLHEGKLALDASFAKEPWFLETRQIDGQRAALQDLRFYQLLRKLRAGKGELSHSAPLALALADGARRLPSLGEPGLDDNVLREPPSPAWRDAWAVTEKLVLAMRDETAARGASFMVVVLSSAGAVYPNPALRLRYAEALGVEDLFYPERRMRALGERHGITVVTLGEQMQRHADATGAYVHGFRNTRLGFGHWNKTGHALAAELIARRMCSQ